MEFLPWKTVDLDGAFRVTAPESISEEVIQEVSNAVTFRFSSATEAVRLEILLTPPWGWEDCFPAEEQKQPPARFICRLISRSTGRRIVVPLEDDGLGLWFAEHDSQPFSMERRSELKLFWSVRQQQTSPAKGSPTRRDRSSAAAASIRCASQAEVQRAKPCSSCAGPTSPVERASSSGGFSPANRRCWNSTRTSQLPFEGC